MRRLAGQAARHGGRLLHALAQLALAAVVLGSVAIGGVAWRLARGPVQVAWLVPLLQQTVADADAPVRVSLGGASVAWEGFRGGLDEPLDIRLAGVTLTDTAGRQIVTVPRAAVALAPGWLLLGRLVPRAIALDGARLHVRIDRAGGLGFDFGARNFAAQDFAAPQSVGAGGLSGLLRALAARPGHGGMAGGRSRWSELRRVRIDDAAITVDDREHDLTWGAPLAAIDLVRHDAGGIAGAATATLALGGLSAIMDLRATVAPNGQQTELHARVTPIDPAAIARAVPLAAPLAALDAPVTLTGAAQLDADLGLATFGLTASAGAGTLHLAEGTAPILATELAVQGTTQRITADLARLVTAPRPDGPRTTLTGHATLTRLPDRAEATIALDLDRVAFADLAALWPRGIGESGVRPWITQNITAGTARDVHLEAGLSMLPDFSGATLTRLAGGGAGHDVTVQWLPPVPPIVHGDAKLTLLGPDTLEVVATAGQEVMGHDAITLRGGRVLFSGLQAKDQFADIDADLAGSVPAALTLLNQPRIRLLERSPLKSADAAGAFSGHLTLAHLPLRDDVTMDDLQIRTALTLTGLRLGGIAAGRDLDRGAFDLTADTDRLHVAGDAAIAGIPAHLVADMDFRAGPPEQVVQTLALSGTLDAAQLAGLGVDVAGFASGAAQASARLTERRDHSGEATLQADLAAAALTLDALAYRKPVGAPARLDAHVALDRDRIVAVDAVQAEGAGLRLAGSVAFADGRPAILRIDHVVLGTTTDARGSVIVPHRPGEVWRADLFGTSIDVSGALKHRPEPPKPAQAGPPYRLDARFDRVVLGHGRFLAAVVAHAENDGQVMQRLTLAANTANGQPIQLDIEPQARGGRHLAGTAADAGALLRAFDVVDDVEGGRLTLDGSYDDAAAGHPLNARAEVVDFRVRHVPALAKLLQAMTLYGLVDLMQGPGLGFSRLIAPFRLSGDVLEFSQARAFSSSLGMTAKGRIDLARQAFDLDGTIVPAYFFNSLLGDLPIVGRLFSPERGGGVFAATYSVRGPLDDPRISVNPLAALTPGFLRGLFGLL